MKPTDIRSKKAMKVSTTMASKGLRKVQSCTDNYLTFIIRLKHVIHHVVAIYEVTVYVKWCKVRSGFFFQHNPIRSRIAGLQGFETTAQNLGKVGLLSNEHLRESVGLYIPGSGDMSLR
jgi:hypothetical protein